jgi:hypothetical protein
MSTYSALIKKRENFDYAVGHRDGMYLRDKYWRSFTGNLTLIVLWLKSDRFDNNFKLVKNILMLL